jgi:hypothetical protein
MQLALPVEEGDFERQGHCQPFLAWVSAPDRFGHLEIKPMIKPKTAILCCYYPFGIFRMIWYDLSLMLEGTERNVRLWGAYVDQDDASTSASDLDGVGDRRGPLRHIQTLRRSYLLLIRSAAFNARKVRFVNPLFRRELTILGTFTNPYTTRRALQLLAADPDRWRPLVTRLSARPVRGSLGHSPARTGPQGLHSAK